MTIVAEREFEIVDEGPARKAQVRIYAPRPAPNGAWTCRYQFAGFSGGWNDQPHAALGADGWQALVSALRIAASALADTPDFKNGTLRLFGEPLTKHNLDDATLISDPETEKTK